MALPALYHWFDTFPRSHRHAQSIAWKEVQDAGFQTHSKIADWCYVFTNGDTWAVVSNVPTSPSSTAVHVVATSNNNDSAKKWAAHLMDRIRASRLTPID